MLSRVASRSYSVTARDAPGNLSTVSVVINNAGSKAGKAGISHLLSKSMFLNTEVKSGLRFTRESELLGGIVSTEVTRDAIILTNKFLKPDLPYFIESLANVLSKTSFRPHELAEIVLPSALDEFASSSTNSFKGLEALHEISFKKGYGNPLYYDGAYNYSSEDIKSFASSVYTADNINFFASGVIEQDLKTFLADANLDIPATTGVASTPVVSYVGKESRIRASGASYAAIGLPVAPADFAKFDILSATIGSSIIPTATSSLAKVGASSKLLKYNDAGLFVVEASGDATTVAQSIKAAKSIITSVATNDLKNSVKAAQLANGLQSRFETPLTHAIEAASAQPVKFDNFNYVAVGDVDVLPFADEL